MHNTAASCHMQIPHFNAVQLFHRDTTLTYMKTPILQHIYHITIPHCNTNITQIHPTILPLDHNCCRHITL